MLKDASVKRVVVATGRTDLRRGIDGLVTLVRLNFGMNPLDGTLFLFCGTKKDRIKGLLSRATVSVWSTRDLPMVSSNGRALRARLVTFLRNSFIASWTDS